MDTDAHGIQSTNEYGGTTFDKPKDLGVPKDKSWYKQYALYVSSKYNFIVPRFNQVPLAPNEVPRRWATEILLNESLIKSEYDNPLFGFMGRDEHNNALATKFIKEHLPYVIFKHIWGNIRKNCMDLPRTVYANSIYNEALEEKDLSINMAKMKIDHADKFAGMQEMGAEFKPTGAQEFESAEEVDEYSNTMQDAMAEFFTCSTKDFLYSQHWEEKCSKMAEYLIPAYFCRVELIPHEKDIEWVVHRPAQCIWDNSFDDELGRRQRIQAVVENCSVPSLLSRKEYNWSDTEIKEIQNLASEIPNNSDTIIQLNNMSGATNLIWWGMLNRVPSIAVVKCRWISWDEENDCETWYQCDYIGNKFVKNAKKCDNITYNKDGSMNTPFLDFIPEMTYGINIGIITRMREITGLIEGITAKINSLVARAKGKVPVFFGDKVPTGTTQASLLKQVASGLVFLKGTDIDQIQAEAKTSRSLADVLDLTAAVVDIQTFRNEISIWENKLREMASTPLIQLGAQTQIIGKGVQEQTIEQSTVGMIPLYHGFMLYVNQILNVQAQMKKGLISMSENTEKYALQVSKNQYKYFEVTKEFSLPELQIYLSQSDQIDEADKAHIRALAERDASIPNSWFNTLDAVELLTMSTKTEMVNYLRYKKKMFDAKQAKLAAEQQAAEAAAQQAQQQTQLQQTEIQTEGTLANTALKQKGDEKYLAMEHVLEDGKEQPTK